MTNEMDWASALAEQEAPDASSSEPSFGERSPMLGYLGELSIDGVALAAIAETNGGSLMLARLAKNGCVRIEDLLELTRSDVLGWPGIGVGKCDEIIKFIDALGDATPAILRRLAVFPADGDAPITDPDLLLVAQWGQFAATATNWGEAADVSTSGAVPDDVAAAITSLRVRTLGVMPDKTAPMVLIERWLESLDDRDRAILIGRLVRAPQRTLDDIGIEYGVTRERIRQLEVKLLKRIPDLLADPAWRPVAWEVFAVQQRFGSYAPLAPTEAAELSTVEGFPRAIVLWLAGFDRLDDRVVARGFKLPKVTDLATLDDGPVIDQEALTERLTAGGVAADLTDWAIDQIDGVGRVDGRPVLWPRNIVAKSYAVLAVRETPLTPEELFDAIGGGVSMTGLRDRLFNDPRLARVSRTRVGLRSWGGDEYTSIVGQMCAELEAHGELDLAGLATDLASRFEVSEASVALYASAPVFVSGKGKIRLRGSDDPFVPKAKPSSIRGMFRTSDALILNVTADADMLRGSGRGLAHEVGTFMGVLPGIRTKLANPIREVALVWLETSNVGPQLGSLKILAAAVDAAEGAALRIVLDRAKHTIDLSLATSCEGDGLDARISALTGLPQRTCTSRDGIAEAVQCGTADVLDVLRDRGEDDLAELVARLPAQVEGDETGERR